MKWLYGIFSCKIRRVNCKKIVILKFYMSKLSRIVLRWTEPPSFMPQIAGLALDRYPISKTNSLNDIAAAETKITCSHWKLLWLMNHGVLNNKNLVKLVKPNFFWNVNSFSSYSVPKSYWLDIFFSFYLFIYLSWIKKYKLCLVKTSYILPKIQFSVELELEFWF